MSQIRVTKEFSFEMSHALEGYDGACRHIHGHSYKFFVTVTGIPVDDCTDPKNGMIVDFGELKRIVNKTVVDRYDHAFVIRGTERNKELLEAMRDYFGKVEIADYQPTCENMIERFAADIMKELPAGITLHSLRLHETATSFAEWFNSDGQ